MLTIYFHPEAEEEYNSAARWYEEQKLGLEATFHLCVDEAIQRILRHPEMYPLVYNRKRRIVVKRFPYAIYYEIKEAELRILSVFHSSRNPEIWKSR